jgi:hypothetical protein
MVKYIGKVLEDAKIIIFLGQRSQSRSKIGGFFFMAPSIVVLGTQI